MKLKNFTDARIFIVDDEPANVALLEGVLGHAGYTSLVPITDSREVETYVVQSTPDIVMLDLMMPRIDGFGVMNRLAEILPEHNLLPILVLTAAATREV